MARVRSTGAFKDDVRKQVGQQIKLLGVYASRLAMLQDVRADHLCDILIEPHQRAFARDVARTYKGNLQYDVFLVKFPVTPPPIDLGIEIEGEPRPAKHIQSTNTLTLDMYWSGSNPFARPSSTPRQFYHDARPELVERIETMGLETLRHSLEYQFVHQVWEWINDFAKTGDMVHARWLLPGVVPLLRRAGQDILADRLQAVRPPTNRCPVPVEWVPALEHANQLIAAGLLLEQALKPDIGSEMAYICLDGVTSYRHPLLPETWNCPLVATLNDPD